MFGYYREKSSWIRNFNAVVINLNTGESSLLIIVTMGESVDQSLAKYIKRHFPFLGSCTNPMYIIFKLQLILKPSKRLFVLRNKWTSKGLVINNEQFVCTLELCTSHNCMEK